MVREDLVEGAVAFLQDPSVANAPVEQLTAFLRSKNLTQDEIDASLARVGQAPSQSNPPSIQYRQPPPQHQNGQYYNQGYPPQWQQPPEPPRRDWRDYFIAATVIGGVGYGVYWTAKRYILPLIAPPTPPQLESDKQHIDEAFDKAFLLLDQLATDTKELKDAESERKRRLDSALGEVEAVISRMKQANDERELESKRMARELADVRESIPRALEKDREQQDNRLKDLGVEMKSLKTLVANRMQGGGVAPPVRTAPSYSSQSQPSSNGHILGSGSPVNGVTSSQSASTASQEQANGTDNNDSANGVSNLTFPSNPSSGTTPASPYSAGGSQERSQTPSSRLLSGKAAIPSWQLAAKKKAEEAKVESGSSAAATAGPETG